MVAELDRLPPSHRDIYCLSIVQGLSAPGIARRLAQGEGNAIKAGRVREIINIVERRLYEALRDTDDRRPGGSKPRARRDKSRPRLVEGPDEGDPG
jgi:hypothetical protein